MRTIRLTEEQFQEYLDFRKKELTEVNLNGDQFLAAKNGDVKAASQAAIKAIRILSKDVGIPEGLIALGKKYGKEVKEEDIPTMTANAQKDACGLTNPRMMSDAAVAAIYKAAL